MDSEALTELAAAESRVLRGAETLDDDAVRAPSTLPGWSRGHVLAHLARNADGMRNLVAWASTGVRTPMYPSPAARAADIEAGSGRRAEDLVADLAAAAERLARALAAMPPEAGDAVVQIGPALTPVKGSELAYLRLREVEIHHVDLDIGQRPEDWSDPFVLRTLDQLVPRFAAEDGLSVGRLRDTASTREWALSDAAEDGELAGPGWLLLGWLTGRVDPRAAAAAGLAWTGGGDVPSAPAWV
jgi:maleylpyruvate isomerase